VLAFHGQHAFALGTVIALAESRRRRLNEPAEIAPERTGHGLPLSKCGAYNRVMTNSTDRVEIITSVQRRRRWTAPEKVRMVEEIFEPGMTVGLVARRHGVAPNQLFTWRRLVAQGSLTAAGSGEEVVPASDYRALQNQVRELHRLLGKKTLEAEILKEAIEHATGSKKQLRLPPSPPKDGSR